MMRSESSNYEFGRLDKDCLFWNLCWDWPTDRPRYRLQDGSSPNHKKERRLSLHGKLLHLANNIVTTKNKDSCYNRGIRQIGQGENKIRCPKDSKQNHILSCTYYIFINLHSNLQPQLNFSWLQQRQQQQQPTPKFYQKERTYVSYIWWVSDGCLSV